MYNYKNFKPSYYDLSVFNGPKAGKKFKDVELFDTNGNKVALSKYIGTPLVIETGSVTCPMYVKCIPKMELLRKEFSAVNFLLIYVREAHPGERIGNHKSISEKIKIAKKTPKLHNDNRIILVDGINGDFHKNYGLLPNIIYVINADGTILFRGDWNNPTVLRKVLKQIHTNKVYHEEHFEPAKPSPIIAMKVLWQGGMVAIWDFLKGIPSLLRLHKNANDMYKN